MRSPVIFALVLGMAMPVAAAGERPAVFLPLISVAVDEAERTRLEDELRTRAVRFGVQPLDRAATTTILKDVADLGLACDAGALECLVRVGGLAAADLVIAGSLTRADKAIDLELTVVDVAAMREVVRQRVAVRAGAERALDVDSALCAVLAPERWRGSLRVNVKQRGASIVVDGVPRGFSPLPRPIALRPGSHEVYVGLEGFRSHVERVEVPYSGGVERDVKLQAGVSKPPPGFSAPAVVSTSATASSSTASPPPAERDRRRPLRVAVYDIDVAGVEERVGRVVGQYLLAEIKKRERTSVIGADEIRALIESGGGTTTTTTGDPDTGDGLGTCTSEQCFADVAEALGADAVVVGQLTVLEGEILFGLRRIDQARQEVTGSVLERVPSAEPVALLGLIGPAVDKLFPDAPLRAGETAGVDERARQRLDPPPLSPAVPLTLGGGALVAGVVSAVGFTVSLSALSSYTAAVAAASGPNPVPADGRTLQETATAAQLGAIVGWSSAAVGAVLGLSAGVSAAFTNWNGDEELNP